jgi:hypothetical protein
MPTASSLWIEPFALRSISPGHVSSFDETGGLMLGYNAQVSLWCQSSQNQTRR